MASAFPVHRPIPESCIRQGRALRPLIPTLCVLAMAISQAHAIGVGRPQTLSALGQPLLLVFPVSLASGETLNPDCVRAEVLAGDSRVAAGSVQLQLEGESEASVRAVRLRTLTAIDEPLVTVSLAVGCPTRLLREYTAFIDPPGASPAPAASVPSAALVRSYSPQMQAALSAADARPSALLASPAEAPMVSPAPPAAVAPASAAASSASAGTAPSSKARPERKTRKPAAKPPGAATVAPAGKATAEMAARPPRGGARLQLEAPEALAASAPQPVSAASAAASVAASGLPAADAQAQRLHGLEQNLHTLQAEQRAMLEQMRSLRGELERAREERHLNPLVYALVVLSVMLAALALYFRRGREQERRLHESTWWSEVKESAREAMPGESVPPTAQSAAVELERTIPIADLRSGISVPPAATSEPEPAPAPAPAPSPALEQDLAPAALRSPAPEAVPAPEPDLEPISFTLVEPEPAPTVAAAAREPSGGHFNVEELIDLEQQVDFFLVLGQEEAALELLRSRIDGEAVDVPLPYLKALRLHQRAGRQDEFQQLARRYAQRFGAAAPDWAQDLEGSGGLLERPQMLALLQRRWADAAGCMALLQAMLVGHADNGSLPEPLEHAGVDLAVMADLLMLYGVARDLSEHEVRGKDIDLFLPLDTPEHSSASSMMATMVWQAPARPLLTAPHALEVDISLDDEDPTPTEPGAHRHI